MAALSIGTAGLIAKHSHPIKFQSMNSINLVGRAGRDPEVKFFESGNTIAELSLAVRGQKKDETDWFNLKIWGKTAQIAADYVRKGSLIGISGRLTIEKWTDRTSGEERSKPVVVVDRLELLGSRGDNEGANPAGSRPAAAPTQPAPGDDEIPF
jgi:single-strand DNA-binding protein